MYAYLSNVIAYFIEIETSLDDSITVLANTGWDIKYLTNILFN